MQYQISVVDMQKKLPSDDYIRNHQIDLLILGLRQSEGGARSTSIHSCYIPDGNSRPYSVWYPLYFMTDKEKNEYKNYYGIRYSDCYEIYGLCRTGCIGCPYGSNFIAELEIIKKYEPQLYDVAINIFGESYDYVRQFKNYKLKKGAEK